MFDSKTCWQHLIRCREEQASNSFGDVGANQTAICKIPMSTARRFIERYEWLGNIGSAQLSFGLFFSERLLAVCCYTRAVAPMGFRTLIPQASRGEIYQLCRGATAPHAPSWSGSRLISRSLRNLHRETRARYVFAYADPRAGEIGALYQASNAIYLGLTDARGPGEYVVNGKRMTPRSVYRRFGSAKDSVLRAIDPQYVRLQRIKKHRYVFLLGTGRLRREAEKAIHELRKPAPKRGTTMPLFAGFNQEVAHTLGPAL